MPSFVIILVLALIGNVFPFHSSPSAVLVARDTHHARNFGIARKATEPNTERASAGENLASFFLPEFQSRANRLSPTGIVSMISEDSSSGSTTSVSNTKPLRQELFNSPLISLLYERVLPPLWEAGLRIGGPDAEYRAAAEFLDGGGGGAILDLSCGTGFVAYRFASAGTYGRVFALDYSDKMLGELVAAIRKGRGVGERGGEGSSSLSVIRGDAGSLPFRSDSLDAVHWGGAMHCVPSAEMALAEVHRVLKPGGKLYATTFLRPFPDVVFRFFTVEELKSLAIEAGFEAANVKVEGKGVYGILRATK